MHENPAPDDIRRLLTEACNVAVVGLSRDPSRPSYGVARSLQDSGFRIFPVNPNLREPVLGERAYDSVLDIEEPVDIVDVFRDGSKVCPVAEEAVRAGARALWLQLGVVNERAARYAAENGLTVVMDRCTKVDYDALVRSQSF